MQFIFECCSAEFFGIRDPPRLLWGCLGPWIKLKSVDQYRHNMKAVSMRAIPSVNRSHKKPRQETRDKRQETRQDKTRQDKTRQDKTRQDKTRQDKTRQDKTRQDKTRAE